VGSGSKVSHQKMCSICCKIVWKNCQIQNKETKRFLQSIDDNFLTQVVEKLTRRGVLLVLVLTNKEGVVEDVKTGGSLGCM